MNNEIIPAILPKSHDDLIEKVSLVADRAKIVHIDVIEETFVPENLELVLPFEVHLMVKEPEKLAQIWLEEGAQRIIVHSLPREVLEMRGMVELGLAVELHIPLEEVYPLLEDVDYIHLMSIREIGRQGNKFETEIFARIEEVRARFREMIISVDGGVNTENAIQLLDSGVNRLIVGSDIFGTEDPQGALETFLSLV